jgi:hypothetical protein
MVARNDEYGAAEAGKNVRSSEYQSPVDAVVLEEVPGDQDKLGSIFLGCIYQTTDRFQALFPNFIGRGSNVIGFHPDLKISRM